MKRIALRLNLVIAAILIAALPALAAGDMGGTMGQDQGMSPQNQKDECLLMGKNCANQTDSILQRIRRINYELSKGEAVYTKSELRRLQNKLDDANRTLEVLENDGG